jgi:hypothetical protein
MKLVTAIVLVSAATLLVAQDAPGGAVEGTVVNSVTGAGINGASVILFGGPSSRYNATTDAVGHFKTFALAAGGPRLRVVLKTWSGTVRGTVENGDGAPVVLIPQRSDGVAIGQSVRCGAGGSFELNEISPGDYYIAAFDRMDGLFPSTATLSLLRARGTSVRVVEGSATSVTLPVVVAPR